MGLRSSRITVWLGDWRNDFWVHPPWGRAFSGWPLHPPFKIYSCPYRLQEQVCLLYTCLPPMTREHFKKGCSNRWHEPVVWMRILLLGSCVWALQLLLVVLFGKAMEPVGRGALLEKPCRWRVIVQWTPHPPLCLSVYYTDETRPFGFLIAQLASYSSSVPPHPWWTPSLQR